MTSCYSFHPNNCCCYCLHSGMSSSEQGKQGNSADKRKDAIESAMGAVELPNRVDLLPRQFVRSHFGTLLEEHSSEKMDCQHVKSTNKEAEMASKAAAAADAIVTSSSTTTLHQKECHFHRERRSMTKDSDLRLLKFVRFKNINAQPETFHDGLFTFICQK